ncbi:anti-sigma-L factor RslA [Mycobacterium cookii]|uniref:Anti-sigma-L factor RslA n=1 Tax=Mycobacterium cookii TaxID=1775 RepID=A0A7I7L390_9MYCO|nr:anti-sigma-L factor RslA [Mycobacterium cookii]
MVPGSGPPGDGYAPVGESHDFATWDAAYVLGSLSPTERREFEAHLSGCPSCSQSVSELSGIPALLSQLDAGTVAAIDEGNPPAEPSATAPNLLPSLLSAVRQRRLRSRVVAWSVGSAAAAVIAVGVFVGAVHQSPTSVPPQASVSALQMSQVGTTALASTVKLSSQHWGTVIDLNCVCLAPVNAHHDKLAMVVVSRDGAHTQLATWVASPGHTANPAGSISTPVDQIAAVQIVSADNGQVLLERSL